MSLATSFPTALLRIAGALVVAAVAGAALTPAPPAGEVYIWRDQQGSVQFSAVEVRNTRAGWDPLAIAADRGNGAELQ